MEYVENILVTIDYTLNTRRKRHLAGGILMSLSLLFAGLSITTFTLKGDVI